MNSKSNFIRKVMCALFVMVCSVAFNSASGAVLASAVGLPAGVGAVAGNAVALVAGQFAPAGVLRAGVLREIWTGEMIKTFRTAPEALGWSSVSVPITSMWKMTLSTSLKWAVTPMCL